MTIETFAQQNAAMDELERARLRIYALEDGAVRAQALSFCLSIGLFDRLEADPMTMEDMAQHFDLSARVLPALVSFLVAQDLLERRPDGCFTNTPAASAFLVPGSGQYIGGRGLLFQGFYEAIRHLPQSLATGTPWTPAGQRDLFAGFGPAEQQWFAEGMLANAVHGARALLRVVDFSSFKRLLDVGGNVGGYTITILAAHPHLTATIFDLPGLQEIAVAAIQRAGLPNRTEFAPGSFFDDELPPGHDVILLSSILHDWGDEECSTILRRCFAGAEPGATIVVTEPMLREDATGPDHPSVSGLTMVVLGGENRAPSRVRRMLEEAGFRDCWSSDVGDQNTVVTGRKPSS